MTHFRTLAASLAATLVFAAPASAELPQGARAPAFVAPGAIAGDKVTVGLEALLKRGPVVLYFFPAAFTPGCNAEANAFAEAIADFSKAGATVVGMTAGNVDQLEKFSAQKCAGKFAVAAASPAIVKAYDVELAAKPGWSTRTTYVIGRDGRIASTFTDMKPDGHVASALAAVRALKKGS